MATEPGSVEFALNYSAAAADMVREGTIRIDRFKCPAWPDLVARAREQCPVYIHFPLIVAPHGRGILDVETGRPVDWDRVEDLVARTDTPLVNVHLAPWGRDYAGMPADTRDPAHVEQVARDLVRSVGFAVERLGPERVIVENDHESGGRTLRPAYLPQVIDRVVQELGCGLLLDLAHARIAAAALGVDVRAYVRQLPLDRVREVHVAGVRRLEGRWLEQLQAVGIEGTLFEPFVGQLLDHLPLSEADWPFYDWALGEVRRGAWGHPWIVTLEYGGVGPQWEAITDRDVLAADVPRLYHLLRG